MNPFKRKKNNDIQDDFLLEIPKAEKSEQPYSPYVLTREEITGSQENTAVNTEIAPFEALKEHMLKERLENEKEKEFITEESFKPSFNINTDIFENTDTNVETFVEENNGSEKINDQLQLSALEEVYGRYPEILSEETETEDVSETSENVSLFQMCMPFISDGQNGEMPKKEPLYTLENVESILGVETKKKTDTVNETDIAKTAVFDSLKFQGEDVSVGDSENNISFPKEENNTFTRTMPVIVMPDGSEKKLETDISSEILGKKDKKTLVDMPVAEDETVFCPKAEYEKKSDVRKIRNILLKKRRFRFLMLIPSVFSLIIMLILKLPVFDDAMNTVNYGINICCFAVSMLCIVSAAETFKSLSTVFKKQTDSMVLYCFSLLSQIMGIILCIANGLNSFYCYYLTFIMTVSTFIFSVTSFRKSVYIYRNFRVVSSPRQKYGVVLIDDSPTVFAMAHRAIDGDALVAAPRETEFVKGFMKNTFTERNFRGNEKLIFILSVFICSFCALAIGIYHQDTLSGLISFATLSAVFCPLQLFCTNTLPLYDASKHLLRYDSGILNVKSAVKTEQANAVAIDCNNIFPKGSVNLHDLKILHPNNLEETIAIATAITETIGSPLFPIFKAAMDTNKTVEMPKADSIKYEERLGITGWVGDSRVFIGNRALMLTHEIAVPDMQVDKQLLSEGFFPVYLARDGKACALFAVSYTPDKYITKELRKITDLGVTVLVNNCDQNLTEEMICDYFDLYGDSVKIMSGSGVHMYKNATEKVESLETCAVTNGKAEAVCGTLLCCVKIKRSVILFTVACILSVVIGTVFFAYRYFGSANLFISGAEVLVYQLISFLVSLLAYVFNKP